MSDETTERGHVLLLEDDETLAALLARVLRNEGYHVDLLDRADALPSALRGLVNEFIAFADTTAKGGDWTTAGFVKFAALPWWHGRIESAFQS